MYDPRSEPKEFIAEDRAAALAKACEFFGVEEEALAVTEFEAGEAHGMAGRAVLVAALRDRPSPAPRERERDRDRDRDRGRGRGRERGDRDRDRDRDRGNGGRRRGGEARGDSGRGRERAAAPEPRDEPTEPSVGNVVGEIGDLGRFVCGVIERMDLGPFEIRESGEEGLVVFELRGDATPRLAGGDGRTVDALQLLVNQVASRLSETPPRVVLDVEGDTDAREERLTRLAERVARRARESGRSVRLDPMSGRDRRIIHLALRDEDGVATMSAGEGRYRQVLVVPEGAPEYEEARRESAAAAERGAD